jgi:hypothetical protein
MARMIASKTILCLFAQECFNKWKSSQIERATLGKARRRNRTPRNCGHPRKLVGKNFAFCFVSAYTVKKQCAMFFIVPKVVEDSLPGKAQS